MKKLLSTFAPLFLIACAGSVEGEVDGDALPPLWSGIWIENDVGELTNVSASATSMLDTCGTMLRVMEERTAFVDELAKDVDEGDDVEDVKADLFKGLDEVDAKILPEDFWTVTVSMIVEDTGDVDGGSFDQDDIGKEGGMVALVCHQAGFPDRDSETGVDDNAECFISSDSKADVNAFEEKGGIDLVGEAELVASDDVEDEVGEITFSIKGSPCPDLEDATEDLSDAVEELFENIGPGGEDDPERDPIENTCSFDDECFSSHRLCDSDFGECVTPETVTATCPAASFLSSSDFEGALLFDARIESGFSDCELPRQFVATYHDAEGDFAPSVSDVTARDASGSSLFIVDVSQTGGIDGTVFISYCANDDFLDVAFQVRDLGLNDSNATCGPF